MGKVKLFVKLQLVWSKVDLTMPLVTLQSVMKEPR